MYSITEDLQSKINKTKSMDQLQKLQEEASGKYAAPSALEYLLAAAAKHGLDKSMLAKSLIQQSTLERTYVYHLLSGGFGLTRDKLLQFAIAGGFTPEETNTLLKYGHVAPLYARDTRDAVLIYSLNRKLSLLETNQALEELGHKLLK